MINQDNLCDYVNLHSYTDSVGWIGYYCRKSKYTTELMREAISQFIGYFHTLYRKASVITSLYKFVVNKTTPQSNEENLMKIGLLRQSFSDNNANDVPIIFEDCNWDEIKSLSSIVMDNAGDIAGHCFIVLDSLGIITYPHDDTGFGFISNGPNNSAKDIVRKFLINLNPNKFQYKIT